MAMEEIKVVEDQEQEVEETETPVEEGASDAPTQKELSKKAFEQLVNGEVLEFLEDFGLKKIQIVDENGNKGTITRYKESLKIETTIKEVM